VIVNLDSGPWGSPEAVDRDFQIVSPTSAGEKVATSSISLPLFEQFLKFLCSRLTPFVPTCS
jgi:hypothetical protein